MKKEWPTREHDITIEEVKATEGLSDLSDEQAKEVITLIKTFSGIVYSLYKREIDGEMDIDDKAVSLNTNIENYRNAA